MNDGDPELLCSERVRGSDLFSFDADSTLIRGINPGNDFTQRTLACAIFTHQRMDCPFLEIDRDIIQCTYTGKVFGNIVNGKERHGGRA